MIVIWITTFGGNVQNPVLLILSLILLHFQIPQARSPCARRTAGRLTRPRTGAELLLRPARHERLPDRAGELPRELRVAWTGPFRGPQWPRSVLWTSTNGNEGADRKAGIPRALSALISALVCV